MTTILGASARHFRQMQQECESLIKERDALREQVRVLSEAAEKPNIPALLSWCAELVKWRYCMSYNNSYFGEPPGELKGITAEIDRLLPTNLRCRASRILPPDVEEAIDRAASKPAGEGGE